MKLYSVRAARSDGAVEQIAIAATSEEAAIRDAGARGLVVLGVRPAQHDPARVRLSGRVLLEFTQSMAVLMRSGVSVRDALEISEGMFSSGPIRLFSFGVREALARGQSFADAAAAGSDSLPSLYRSMIRIGERVGSLGSVFDRLGRYLADTKRLRDRIIGALIYPSMVLVTSLVGAAALMIFVVPRLAAIFAELGSELPPSYTVGKALTVGIVAALAAGVLGGLAVALSVRQARRRGVTRPTLERLLLRLPLLGKYFVLRDTLNLAFAIETLTASGLTVEDALRDAADVLVNRDYRAAVIKVRDAVLRGERLSTAMTRTPPIPTRVGRWAELGERSGAVESVFAQIRAYYQEELERWSIRVSALAEPALILFVGAIIMIIVLALIVPFFSLYGSIQV